MIGGPHGHPVVGRSHRGFLETFAASGYVLEEAWCSIIFLALVECCYLVKGIVNEAGEGPGEKGKNEDIKHGWK